MSSALRQKVRRNAHSQCEYCHSRESDLPFAPFHLDHIVARQHGGDETMENLAWSCHECNLLKGTNLVSRDPETGEVAALFHPRRDRWEEHFKREGNYVRGMTPTGRATVRLLQLNSTSRVRLRAWLQR